MNSNDTTQNQPDPSADIGDRNVERLLGTAYKPEAPDVEFVKRVQSLMCSAAVEQASQHAKTDRKSTRLNSSHIQKSRMPSSA